MEKIKILYITAGNAFDNNQRKFLSLLRNIDVSKYEASIVCSENPLLFDYLKAFDLPIYVLNLPSRISSKYSSLLNKLHLGEKFHIVHSFGYIPGIYSRLLKKFNPGIKCIHSPDSVAIIEKKGVFTKQLVKSTMQYYSLFTDVLVTENEYDKRLAVRNKYIQKPACSVIPPSVNVSRFANIKMNSKLMHELGFNRDNFIIGSVAGFNDYNNQQLIIRAGYYLIKKYPQVRFLFIGSGKNLKSMIEFSKTSGIGDFSSFVSEKQNIEEYYSVMDLFIAPDKWGGSTFILLEAMASKLPVLCSISAEYSQFSQSKQSLSSFDPDDMDDLFEKTEHYFRNKEERDMLAQNAMLEATQFDDSEIIPRMEKIYQEVAVS